LIKIYGQVNNTPAAIATLISLKKASVTLVPIKPCPGCRVSRSGATMKAKIALEKK
jgi:hypothetical protein